MFDFLRHATTPPNDLLGIIRYVRARWRAEACRQGRGPGVCHQRGGVLRPRLRDAVGAVHALLDSRCADRCWPPRSSVAVVLLPRQAAAAPRHRRPGGALPRRERAVAQAMLISAVESSREGRHWESTALVQKLVAQAIEKCCEADTARRAEHGPLRANGAVFAGVVTAAMLAVLLGPAFFRHALSAVLHRVAQRRGGGAVQDRGHARQHLGAEGRGSDDRREAPRVQCAECRRDGAPGPDLEDIREACRSCRNDKGDLRRDRLRREAAPLEYFVEAEGVRSTDLHAEGRRRAVRPAARARIQIPRVHRPRAAEDRGRRRHRGAARHRRQGARSPPTMKTQGRPDCAERQGHGADLTLRPTARSRRRSRPTRTASYHVELEAPNGERVAASPQYTIDVLDGSARRRCRSRVPAATRRRRRSKRCSSRRAPTTTTASGSSSWSTR